MKKFKLFLRWLLPNTAWYMLAALGAIAGVGWAWALFAFTTWVLFLASSFIAAGCLAREAMKKPIEFTVSRGVPAWIDVSCDLALMLMLVATGHWFYGFLMLLHILEYQYIFKSCGSVV